MPLPFVFVYLIWQFPVFSEFILLLLFLFPVPAFQLLSFLNLVHQFAPVHIFLFHLTPPLFNFPLPQALFALFDGVVNVLLLHVVPDRVGADVAGLQLLLVAEEHVVVLSLQKIYVFVSLFFNFFGLLVAGGSLVELSLLSHLSAAILLALSILLLENLV